MNILILCHEFPPIGGGGGNAAWHISKKLSEQGYNVHVFTTNFNKTLPEHEVQDGVTITRVRGWRKSLQENHIVITFTYFFFAGLLKLPRYIRQHDIEVIHSFFTLPAGLLGILLKAISRKKVIVSLRGSDVPYHNPLSRLYLAKPLIRAIWNRADRVVALSQGLKSTAQRTQQQQYDVIYNGVDTADFSPCTKPKQESEGLRLRIISVCRLEEIKGLQFLFPALKELKEEGFTFDLTIAGEGPYRNALEALIHQLDLVQEVKLLGYQGKSQLQSLMCQSDLFVLPSLSESFGQVFTEAMACGLPAIGTNVGGIPEIIKNGVNGWLVEPQSTEQLREKLRYAFSLPETELARIGKANVADVKSRFQWSIVAGNYAELYHKVQTSC